MLVVWLHKVRIGGQIHVLGLLCASVRFFRQDGRCPGADRCLRLGRDEVELILPVARSRKSPDPQPSPFVNLMMGIQGPSHQLPYISLAMKSLWADEQQHVVRAIAGLVMCSWDAIQSASASHLGSSTAVQQHWYI